MAPTDEEVEQSIKRIRRGCFGSAVIFMALTVLFVSATGNLAFLLLLLVSAALMLLSRLVR